MLRPCLIARRYVPQELVDFNTLPSDILVHSLHFICNIPVLRGHRSPQLRWIAPLLPLSPIVTCLLFFQNQILSLMLRPNPSLMCWSGLWIIIMDDRPTIHEISATFSDLLNPHYAILLHP